MTEHTEEFQTSGILDTVSSIVRTGNPVEDEFAASKVLAAAYGTRITRLHEPSFRLLDAHGLQMREDGIHIVLPPYDGSVDQRMELTVSKDGTTVPLGRLEAVHIGGCLVTLPVSVNISAAEITPFDDFDLEMDGMPFLRNRSRGGFLFMDGRGMLVKSKDKTISHLVVGRGMTLVCRNGVTPGEIRRSFGVLLVGQGDGSWGDYRVHDIGRKWPEDGKGDGPVPYLPKKKGLGLWDSTTLHWDPSGREEEYRSDFSRSLFLPEWCLRPHTPRFGLVGGRVDMVLTDRGPVLQIPALEYIEGPEPVILLRSPEGEWRLPPAGTTECGGYRVRLKQYINMVTKKVTPFGGFQLVCGETVLYWQAAAKVRFFNTNGFHIDRGMGDCFAIIPESSPWKDSAKVLDSANIWGMRLLRVRFSRESSLHCICASGRWRVLDTGGWDIVPVAPVPAKEKAPVGKVNARPKRIRPGTVLEDGAVVVTARPDRGLDALTLEGTFESEADTVGRLVRTVLASTGRWSAAPHPPARGFIGPEPTLALSDFRVVLRTVCYEGGEDDRFLAEVRQGDRVLVLYPMLPTVGAGGCRLSDGYEVDLVHAGIDPFEDFVLLVDGREVFSSRGSPVLFFDKSDTRSEPPLDEAVVCFPADRVAVSDEVELVPSVTEGGLSFVRLTRCGGGIELLEPSVPEEARAEPIVPEGTPEAPDEALGEASEDVPEDTPDKTTEEPQGESPEESQDATQEDTPVPSFSDVSATDPFRAPCVSAELLGRAVALFEGSIDLGVEEEDPDRPDTSGFVGGVPSLFFSGTSCYLYIPRFRCGAADQYHAVLSKDGETVGSLPLRVEDGLTEKVLVDLSDYGLCALDAFVVRIGWHRVYRNRGGYFLLFDAEGRRTNRQADTRTIVFGSGTVVRGGGFEHEILRSDDRMTVLAITPAEEGFRFSIRAERGPWEERVSVIRLRGFEEGSPEVVIRDAVPVLALPPYNMDHGGECTVYVVRDGIQERLASLRLFRYSGRFRTGRSEIPLRGVDPLSEFTVTIDGDTVLENSPAPYRVYAPSGATESPSGDVWMIYSPGLVPCGRLCTVIGTASLGENRMVRADVAPGGTILATPADSLPSDADPLFREPAPVPEEATEEEPEEIPAESLQDVQEEIPAAPERPDCGAPDLVAEAETVYGMYGSETNPDPPQPDYVSGYGFFDMPPSVMFLGGRPVLVLPPYSGSPGDPFEVSVSRDGDTTVLGKLTGDGRVSTLTAVFDLKSAGIGVLGGFTVSIDGREAFRHPCLNWIAFGPYGCRTTQLAGDLTIVVDGGHCVEGAGMDIDIIGETPDERTLSVSAGEGAVVRVRRLHPSEKGPVAVWPERGFVRYRPDVRLVDGRPALFVPRYRCVPGDPCTLTVTSGDSAVTLDVLDPHPGMGASVTSDVSVDLASNGIDPLRGLKAEIDGREVLDFGARDHASFVSSGMLMARPRGRVTMFHEPGTVPVGEFRKQGEGEVGGIPFIVADLGERGHIGVSTVEESECGGPPGWREEPEEPESLPESEYNDDPESPVEEEIPEDRTAPTTEPGTESEEQDRTFTFTNIQRGFYDGSPKLCYSSGRFVIDLPPYRGRPGDPMECCLKQDGLSTVPFKISCVRMSDRLLGRRVSIVIPEQFDPLRRIGVYVDGLLVHHEPDREVLLFPGAGGELCAEGRYGRMVAFVHPGTELITERVKDLEEDTCHGLTRMRFYIGTTGFFGTPGMKERRTREHLSSRGFTSDDLLRSDGLLESEHRRLEEDRRKEEEPVVPRPSAGMEKGTFREGGPSLNMQGTRFVLRVPAYAAEPGRPLRMVLFDGGDPVSLGRLEGRRVDDVYLTEPTDIDLRSIGASPFHELELMLDGESVFRKDTSEVLLLDSVYRYTGRAEGRTVAVTKKGSRVARRRASLIGRRREGGYDIYTLDCAENATVEYQPPWVEPERYGFGDGPFPELCIRDGRVFLLIPRYLGFPSDQYDTTLEQNGRTVPTPPLIPVGGKDHGTLPARLDLGAFGISPMEDFLLRIDGRTVYANHGTDRLLFDHNGDPCVSVSGHGYVMMRSSDPSHAVGAGIISVSDVGGAVLMEVSVSDGGTVEVGPRVTHREMRRAIAEVPEIDGGFSGMGASFRLVNRPEDVVARLPAKDDKGNLYKAAPIPLFSEFPRVRVDLEGCDPEDCVIHIVDRKGRTLFGPVRVTDGVITLDTGTFSGTAIASVRFGSRTLCTMRYLVDCTFGFTVPDERIHDGDSVVVYRSGGEETEVRIYDRDGSIQTPWYKAFLRLNVTMYYLRYPNGANARVPLFRGEVGLGRLREIPMIVVTAKVPRNVPPVKKRVLVRSNGSTRQLSRTWLEGEMPLPLRGVFRDVLRDGGDHVLLIEEEGRGSYPFLTVFMDPGSADERAGESFRRVFGDLA